MADHRHHLRALTLVCGTFGAFLILLTLAPSALAACEDASKDPNRDGTCIEETPDGRCKLWDDGQILLGSGNRLPLPEGERDPLPPDRFKLYAVVSPCNGGPPPPNQTAYDCPKRDALSANCTGDGKFYNIWTTLYEKAEPLWQRVTPDDWEWVDGTCITTDQGAAHGHIHADHEPWITYVASYPGGDLHTQPSNGQTLVGFPTNFFTELPTEIRYETLHNSGWVTTCVEPKRWVWDFDDGHTAVTNTPGAPYSPGIEPKVTHAYEENREFEPSVSVQYKRYLNSGSGWSTTELLHQSLPGQGHPLEMFELMPRLISPYGR